MTSFLDVIQPLTDQLKAMSKLAGEGIHVYTQGTKKFQNHTNDVGKVSGPIIFEGQGADAFKGAVNYNADLSTKALTRLGDFQQACNDTWKKMEYLSMPYDSESRYLKNVLEVVESGSSGPYETHEYDYFINANLHGYTLDDGGDLRIAVVRTIREGILPGLNSQLGTLLDPKGGPGLLNDQFGPFNSPANFILGDFQNFQSERETYLYNAFQKKEISHADYQYYLRMVEPAFTGAADIVNAIATNMQDGYIDWDREFIAAASNFVSQVGDVDSGNLAQYQLYNQIDSEFHDPRTQALLDSMLNSSPYGAKVVQYLLNIGDCSKGYSPCGDNLIVWQDGMPPNVGAYNKNNVIYLNSQGFNPDDPNSLAATAGLLAHESVETYYERAYHIPADTLPMDYTADYVRQVVSNQMLGKPVGKYPDYQTWKNDPNNVYVKDFKESDDPGGDLGDGIDTGWWDLTHGADPNFAGNPMGLDPSLLQNGPDWDISKYWNPATNSFQPAPIPGV